MSADAAIGAGAARAPITVSRRFLGAATAGVAASTAWGTASCDTDEPLDLPGLPGLPTPGEEPDHDRVVAGLRDEQVLLAHVVRVRRRHQRLRRSLAATEAVHQAHVDLLSRAVDEAGGVGDRRREQLPADVAQAVAQLVRLERWLAERHVRTAMASHSGVLARVVASMSAAAAQQAVVLAPLAVARPGQGG